MADAKTVLQKYLSDMVALQSHIYQAIDKQVKENSDHPEIQAHFQTFATTVKSQRDGLDARLKELGGAANQPIKEGVAALFGVAAGVIDKFRSDEESKDFRDDLTALNLSVVSYEMLFTTAKALSDTQTADLAASYAKQTVEFISYMHKMLPDVVIWNLQKNYKEAVNASVSEQSKSLFSNIWH